MGKATIEEFPNLDGGLGVVDRSGLSVTNVTTSGTAANTTLSNGTRGVRIYAEDTDVRVDVGVSVTADANSVLLPAGSSKSIALSVPHAESYRVSIIDA